MSPLRCDMDGLSCLYGGVYFDDKEKEKYHCYWISKLILAHLKVLMTNKILIDRYEFESYFYYLLF